MLQALRLVNNLIDITCIDSGFLNINLKNDDIVAVVEDICQSVVEYVQSFGISILFDTDVEEKVMAFDSDKIERYYLICYPIESNLIRQVEV